MAISNLFKDILNRMNRSSNKTQLGDVIQDLGEGKVDLARGNVLVGNSSGVAAALDANDDAKILVGDGTDLASVAVSGDISLANSGAVSLADESVAPAEVANIDSNIGIPLVIDFEITADASSGLNIFDANAPFKFEIIDIVAQARATVGGGCTITISDGTNTIADSINLATDKAIARVGSIDDAYSEIAASGTLKVATTDAAGRGLVSIYVVKRA